MKRIQELRQLSDDHHHGLVLARRAVQAGVDRRAEVWKEIHGEFETELEPHFQVEEKWIFQELESLGEIETAVRGEREHRELRELIREETGLETFGERLERHIRFEEREMFEMVQKIFSRTALKAIEDASRRKRRRGT